MGQHQYAHGAATPTALLLILATAWVAAAAGRRELVQMSSTTSVAELMSGMKSPLSKSEATSYAQLYKRTGSVGDLCQTGHLYCNAQAYEAYYEKVLQPDHDLLENVEEKGIAVYFRESELMVGHQVTVVDQRLQSTAIERNRQALDLTADPRVSYINFAKMPERAFLPAELAHTLPMSSGSAAQIFSLDESSTLAKESSKTVKLCKEAVHEDGTTPLEGEAASCATSLEELQSLLRSPMLLGPHVAGNVEALTPDSNLQGSFTGQVADVILKASETSRHTVCHNLMYPSAVYFCHYLPNTRVYAVTLQQAQAPYKILRSVAMCHLDTTGWNPRHLAFQNLGTVPGQGEACHWVLAGSVTFVPAA